MKWVAILLVLLLVALHQDWWWWGDRSVLFGFLPIGLAWHVGISIAAGLVWALAVKFWWPRLLEDATDSTPAEQARPKQEDH